MTRDISRITLYEAHLISSIGFGKQGFQESALDRLPYYGFPFFRFSSSHLIFRHFTAASPDPQPDLECQVKNKN